MSRRHGACRIGGRASRARAFQVPPFLQDHALCNVWRIWPTVKRDFWCLIGVVVHLCRHLAGLSSQWLPFFVLSRVLSFKHEVFCRLVSEVACSARCGKVCITGRGPNGCMLSLTEVVSGVLDNIAFQYTLNVHSIVKEGLRPGSSAYSMGSCSRAAGPQNLSAASAMTWSIAYIVKK